MDHSILCLSHACSNNSDRPALPGFLMNNVKCRPNLALREEEELRGSCYKVKTPRGKRNKVTVAWVGDSFREVEEKVLQERKWKMQRSVIWSQWHTEVLDLFYAVSHWNEVGCKGSE